MTNSTTEHPRMNTGRSRLQGKVAIITAADSGIGRATARLFAREGASVVCVDIAERSSIRIDHLITQDGGQAEFLFGDASVSESYERAVETALSRFGGLDILFLNAGNGVRAKIHEISEEAWDQVIKLNLYGMFHGARSVIPHFLAQGSGNIVATASSFGLMASPSYPAYCASKAAIVNLTREMAIDYGPDIRVNCVCPGPTETQRIREFPLRPRQFTEEQKVQSMERVNGLKRLALPEEIAYAVLFLASEESSFVTGHALVVDGGQTIASM